MLKKIKHTTVVIFLLWLGHLINNYVWLRLDKTFLTYDSHRHFLVSLKIFDAYRNFSSHILANIVQATQLHPPLVAVLTAPFYFIFGSAQDTGVMINAAIFLGVLIFSTYKLGAKLCDTKTGLLAAFLITMYPVVFNQLKVYMLDLPLTALVVLSIYFLTATDNFMRFKYSLLFGICCGLGMLVKQSFIVHLIGPLIYVIVKGALILRRSANSKKDIVRDGLLKSSAVVNFKTLLFNLFFSIFLATSICLPYYFSKISIALVKVNLKWVTTWIVCPPNSGELLNILRSLLWNLWGLVNWQLSFFYFVIFLVGLFLSLRTSLKQKGIIYLWLLSSWILTSILRHSIGFDMEVTGVRYTMPLLPAVALITSNGIMSISFKKIKNSFIVAIALFGFLQLFFVSYFIEGRLSKNLNLPIRPPEKITKYRLFPENIIIFNWQSWVVSGRDGGSYFQDAKSYLVANERIYRIIDFSSGNKEDISVLVIPDNTQLWYLQYKFYIDRKNFKIFCDWNYVWLAVNTPDADKGISGLLDTVDYVIDKDGGWLGEPYMQYLVTIAKTYFNQHKDGFELVGKVEWPDDSNILIFKRKTKDQ